MKFVEEELLFGDLCYLFFRMELMFILYVFIGLLFNFEYFVGFYECYVSFKVGDMILVKFEE